METIKLSKELKEKLITIKEDPVYDSWPAYIIGGVLSRGEYSEHVGEIIEKIISDYDESKK